MRHLRLGLALTALALALASILFWKVSLARNAAETVPTPVIYAIGPSVPTTTPASPGQRAYESTAYGFGLEYPEALAVEEYPELYGAMSAVFKDVTTGMAFQIYVTPYGDAEITEERFALDQPSGVRENEREYLVDGAHGIRFDGTNAAMGDTIEVWVINDGYLYEIATYARFEELLDEILKTWRFI